MGRPKSAWLGFVLLLPLLSSAQQQVPASEQRFDDHVIPSAATASALAQTGATQPAVPQTSAPPAGAPAAFEVSTVKLSKADNGNSGSNFNNGRFTATNVQLKNIMEYSAYGIPQPRILGGPKWLDSQRFDIQAKMESAVAQRLDALSRDQARAEMRAMFQQLLADRFKRRFIGRRASFPSMLLSSQKAGPFFMSRRTLQGSPVLRQEPASSPRKA
jgi:hypothetical protein